ncbi:MAG: hypothetical protein ABJN26_07915 [Stappiaceae bacterium]
MKRILASFSALALLALAACNGEKAPEGSADQVQQQSAVPETGEQTTAASETGAATEPAAQ